jgi:hypothetical protein
MPSPTPVDETTQPNNVGEGSSERGVEPELASEGLTVTAQSAR